MPATMQQACKELWEVMSTTFKTKIVNKNDATEMRTIAWCLDSMGILDQDRFLKRYTTTVYKWIYVPWEIGEGSDAKCWSQMRTCVHEHQHVIQWKRDGFLKFAGGYLIDGDDRAKYEAEAKACGQEMHFWRYGKVEDPERACANLVDYNMNKDEIAFAARVLDSYQRTIKRGGTITKAGKVALDFLSRNHSHLSLRKG
jgi:hypothetical protein